MSAKLGNQNTPCFSKSKFIQSIDSVDIHRFDKIEELITFECLTEESISIIGWTFDVCCTIYQHAKADEVRSGWEYLARNNIPLDTFVRAFLMKAIDDVNNPPRRKEVGDWIIDIQSEPEILELIRLCYWLQKCRSLIVNSFLNKFSEIREQLSMGGTGKLGENFAKRCTLLSKVLLDTGIPIWERNLNKSYFSEELNDFRFVVSSFVSEVMFAAILKIEGFDVEFPKVKNDTKVCDMLLNNHKLEVKTIFDQTQFSETEDTLSKELEATLKRKKIIDHVDDALSKEADIIMIVLTFCSVGTSVHESAVNGEILPSFSQSIKNSIEISDMNKSKANKRDITEVPIIILVTGINFSDKQYLISTIQETYPVSFINGRLKADRDRVKINI